MPARTLEVLQNGGYELLGNSKMAKVIALPKKHRETNPTFFYDEHTQKWSSLDMDAKIIPLNKKWAGVCKLLTALAIKRGFIC